VQPGALVATRFEIESLAAQGGMGKIYRARDHHTGQPVALKVLSTPAAEYAERFLREAEVLVGLAHPAIVKYVAHGSTTSGELYLATEWLEGETLSVRLERATPSIGETLQLMRLVAEGLAEVHRHGIVHRDIKPSNLFLPSGQLERVKILDFGIAHFANAPRLRTRTGAVLGTPGYLAPEQARGERKIDARADVFALGCVLFECLAGRPAFLGEHVMAVLGKILLEDAPRLVHLRPDVPPPVDVLVGRMLDKDPDRRPRDAGEVAETLGALGPVGDSLAVTSAPPAVLTTGEQRLLSVILARAAPRVEKSMETAPTLSSEFSSSPELREVVAEYGGRLERLADGSVVATLDSAGAATDQAALAARCALAVRAFLPAAPMALATGRGVVAGRWPVGEVLDRAGALLRLSESTRADLEKRGPPPLRLDELTAGLLDQRFDVGGDAAGLVLHGERGVETTRTLLGRPTPFVGRENELDMLERTFRQCVDEPMARAVLVTAPPGYGKSRLRRELLAKLKSQGVSVEVLLGRGDPMSAGAPFGLIGPALRHAAGVLDGEPAQLRQTKFRARISRSLGGEDRARIVCFLGELAQVPPLDGDDNLPLRAARQDAILMGDQMRRAWEDWLLAESETQPVLLILEDLHWGDLPTVKYVDAALRHLHDRPLMVLALARPEVHELFPRLWAERAPSEIRLGELPRKAGERLVREVLGERLSADAVRDLVQRAAGNALWLEELIRAAAEGDETPGTVLAMLQARLERLAPGARHVLRAGSVFGQAFWGGGVRALVGGRADTAAEWLHELSERELIQRRPASRFPGETEYVFRHALVRDAAYAMLTEHDRALGHRLAGEWLESVGENEAVVLAEHFERGSEPGRAVGWYRQAAEQALEGNDFQAVLERVERGVNAACVQGAAPDEEVGALRLLEAEAHRWRNEHIEAERCGVEALRFLPRRSRLWYDAMAEVAIASGRRGNQEQLVALADELGRLPWGEAATAAQVGVGARVAGQLLFAAQTERADALLAQMQAVPETIVADDPSARAWLREARSFRAHFAGDIAAALALLEDAVSSFESAGHLRDAALGRVNLAYLHLEVGAYADAEADLREALSGAERMGLKNVSAAARQNLALALAHQGRLDEARRLAEETSVEFHSHGDLRMEAASRVYLATIRLIAGDGDGAAEAALEAAEIAPSARAHALATAAMGRLEAGRTAEALEAAREARDLLERAGAVDEGEARIRLAWAEALAASGEKDAAREAIREARARLEERASRLSNAATRASFLERVRDHARTLALAREWDA
jgi:eukaryotic-like serine/threonine-protein kinase